jgi:hypothetical protein
MELLLSRNISIELVEGKFYLNRYFPSQPVQCATTVGGTVSNGGCEAFIELQKALNTLGDYRLSAPVNNLRWAMNPGTTSAANQAGHSLLPEFDFDYSLVSFKWSGSPLITQVASAGVSTDTLTTNTATQRSGDCGSGCFSMAIDLETSNGLEISGLNAEEQSDISLIARFSSTQSSGFLFDVFTYIDSMIVLRENNVNFILIIGFGINSISKLCDCFNKWVISVLTKLLSILNFV